MGNGVLGTNIVASIGILVKDIDAMKKKYAAFLGLPEPEAFWTGDIKDTRAEYLGRPCPAKARLAFFDIGPNLQLELIQPDDQPSLWRDNLERHGEGFHEISFRIKGTNDKIAALTKNGMPVIQRGEYPGGRYAYIDSLKDLKILIETLEND